MTTLEIIFLAVPIVGNLVALVLRAMGYHRAADIVDQVTPVSLRLGKAAANKDREQAIGAALDALAIASTELGPDHPVSKVEGEIRKHLRPSKPPPAAPPPLLLLMFVVGCVPLLGCASPLETAVQVQHSGAAAIEHGGEELQERCTDRLVPLAELPTQAERMAAAAPIREVCDPARMAYGSARAAHVLLSATLAALAGGVAVGEIVDITSLTARALAELARTFAALRGEK